MSIRITYQKRTGNIILANFIQRNTKLHSEKLIHSQILNKHLANPDTSQECKTAAETTGNKQKLRSLTSLPAALNE